MIENKSAQLTDENDLEIGRKIRRLRMSKGLSQVEVSKTLHMSAMNYNNLELGRIQISMTRLRKLAGILQVSAASLLMEGDADKFYTRTQVGVLVEKLKAADQKIMELQGKLIECYESKGCDPPEPGMIKE